MTKEITYQPEVCTCCSQKTTYIIALDKGSAQIVKQMAKFIGQKGINCVHPRKEMEGKWLTSNQVGNLTRPRSHGLIAKVRGEPGNYLLTTKGAQFLRGAPIPKFAIMSKAERHQIGYFEPEKYQVTVDDFNSKDDYWEGVGFEIEEGRIIYPEKMTQHQTTLI